MVWMVEHRGFAVRTFFENVLLSPRRGPSDVTSTLVKTSILVMQPDVVWVREMESTGSTENPSRIGKPRTVRTPENVNLVRAVIEQPPRCSARKRVIALGMSNRSLRWILREDL